MDLIILREHVARLTSTASGNESNAARPTKERCSNLIHRALKSLCLAKRDHCWTCPGLSTWITVKWAKVRRWGDNKTRSLPVSFTKRLSPGKKTRLATSSPPKTLFDFFLKNSWLVRLLQFSHRTRQVPFGPFSPCLMHSPVTPFMTT